MKNNQLINDAVCKQNLSTNMLLSSNVSCLFVQFPSVIQTKLNCWFCVRAVWTGYVQPHLLVHVACVAGITT